MTFRKSNFNLTMHAAAKGNVTRSTNTTGKEQGIQFGKPAKHKLLIIQGKQGFNRERALHSHSVMDCKKIKCSDKRINELSVLRASIYYYSLHTEARFFCTFIFLWNLFAIFPIAKDNLHKFLIPFLSFHFHVTLQKVLAVTATVL